MVFESSIPEEERALPPRPTPVLNINAAKARSLEQRPHNENGKRPSLWTPISNLIPSMGRAPILYLNFVQICFIYTLLLLLLHVPYVVFFVMGRGGGNDDSEEQRQDMSRNIFFRTSIGNWDFSHLWYNVALAACEVAVALLSIGAIRFLLWYSKRLNKLSESVVSIEHFSIHVRRVPPEEVCYSTKRLEKFFSAFGPVRNVVMFLNSGNINLLKKDLENLGKNLRRARTRLTNGYRFLRLYYAIKIRYLKLKGKIKTRELEYHMNKKAYKCTGDALIVFRTERARYKALHTFNKPLLQSCCGLLTPRYVRGIRFRVFKGLSPKDINWENFEYSLLSKILRRSVSVLLTILSMGIGVIVVYILEVLKAAYFSASLVDVGSFSTLKDAINLLGSLGISFANFLIIQVLCFILFYVSGFEKHRLVSHTKQSLMYKLIFSQVLVSTTVIFVYTLTGQQADRLLPILSFQIRPLIFTTLFSIIGFSVLSNVVKELLLAPWHLIKQKIRVKQSMTQEELNDAHTPPKYSIEYRYSFQLKSIILAVAFSGVWPPALLLLAVGLFFSFIIDKINLMRVYHRFDQAKDLLCESAIKCLSLGIFARFFIQLIFYALTLQLTEKEVIRAVLSHVYGIGVLVAAIVFGIFLLVQFVMPDLNMWQLCCFSMYRFPKYATHLRGRDSIDNYKVEMYAPPVLPKDVKYRFYGEEMEQVRYSAPAGTAVELFT